MLLTTCWVMSMRSAQDTMAYVDNYIALGLRVIPVQAEKKVPSGPWGHGEWTYKRLQDYVRAHPDCNIAVLTGDRLFVIDIDRHDKDGRAHDGRAHIRKFEREHGRLNLTVASLTPGGGLHFWYYWPDGIDFPHNAVNSDVGVDVRGTGGYVLVPPSQIGGIPYRFADGRAPGEVDIATANDHVVELVRGLTRRPAATPSEGLPRVVREGGRNDACYRYACHIRARGGSPEDVFIKAWLYNAILCSPPLKATEVSHIVASALKHKPGRDLLAETAGLPDVGLPRMGGDS